MVDLDDTWLPIATAPKDGTKVKVLYGGEEHIDSYIGPENDPETHNELWGLTPWLGGDPTHWKPIDS